MATRVPTARMFDARQVVLLVVNDVGHRRNGKTFIQKVCFFVGKRTGHTLGFGPHFFGPYSDDVAGDLAFLVGGGLVTESRHGRGVIGDVGWEVAHVDYRLTDKGQEAVRFLDAKYPTESAQVRSAIRQVLGAGSLDYIELSVAAKAAWILEEKGKSLNLDNIANVAGRFRSPVSPSQVERATEFLRKLDPAVVEYWQTQGTHEPAVRMGR
jgi:uncharacterized protein YwgA